MRRFILLLLLVVMFALPVAVLAQGSQQGDISAQASTVYYVRPGDTLSRIARSFGVDVYTLARFNSIYNLNLIYVGQAIYIPTGTVPPPPPPPPPVCTYYTVRYGDTLNLIARLYGVSVFDIQYANALANPNLIYPGMVLCIPPASAPPPPTYVTPYYVQYGDTLARIARHFGTSVAAIVSYNGLSNPNFIYVGQLLHIPHW